MVRLDKKTKICIFFIFVVLFQTTLHVDHKGVQTDPNIRHNHSVKLTYYLILLVCK